jgi:hypothetical protein
MAGIAYGFAALAGASPARRGTAMRVGGVADALLAGVSPRGAAPRTPAPVQRTKIAPPTTRQDSIRLSELNAEKQARGGYATIEQQMLGTGTRADRRILTPGWSGDGRTNNEARAHLIARQHGGSGREPRNLVTLTQNPTNNKDMGDFERATTNNVRSGAIVEYSAIPLYTTGIAAPSAILVTSRDSRGGFDAKLIANPAAGKR